MIVSVSSSAQTITRKEILDLTQHNFIQLKNILVFTYLQQLKTKKKKKKKQTNKNKQTNKTKNNNIKKQQQQQEQQEQQRRRQQHDLDYCDN